MRIETLAVHAGHEIDNATGAVTPAIHLSTTFERDPDGTYSRGYYYGAKGNPNRSMLEECLGALEGGKVAVAFASGCAAITAVLRTLRPGDHVVVPDDMFQGTLRILQHTLRPWGVESTAVDMTQPEKLRTVIRPNTKIIWTETISNPMLKVCDLEKVVAITREVEAICVCDNTFATPVFHRPLDVGVDVVIHATTKYLGGHTDVTGGVVIVREDGRLVEQVREIQLLEGAVPSPFDCWLLLRGLRTLPYRMRAHAENAMRVARFLAGHPMVETVHYPGLAGHPQYELARRSMKMFGGMVSAQVVGGKKAALKVAASLRLFTRATSLGGTESLIEHRASSPIQGTATKTPDNLLRMSIGLEHPDDLIEDLSQAFEAAAAEI